MHPQAQKSKVAAFAYVRIHKTGFNLVGFNVWKKPGFSHIPNAIRTKVERVAVEKSFTEELGVPLHV